MVRILKNSKFFIGIILLFQAFTFLILFMLLYSKKKSVAKTLLTLSAAGGFAGIILALKGAREIEKSPAFSAMDAFCDCDDFDEYNDSDYSDDIYTAYTDNDKAIAL